MLPLSRVVPSGALHMTPLGFVVVALAAARLTHMVTEDTIGQPLRDITTHPLADELVTCPWCIGFWISLTTVAVWYLLGDPFLWLAAPFAVSYIVGWAESRD